MAQWLAVTPLPDLSVQLYSVRQPLVEDFAGTMGRLADIGLTRVEPFGLLDFAEQLRETLPATGLTAPTAHQDLESGDLDATFELATELGVSTIIHPYCPPERWQSREEVERLAGLLSTASTAASTHGLQVAYHNHDWELATRFDGRSALEVFVDLLDPSVLLEVDTYWAATGGEDVPALLGRLGDRVVALHLKDGPLNGDKAAQLPLGSGDLPAAEIVAAAAGVRFAVLEFDEYAGDIFEGIATSYAYATETLGAPR